MALNGIVGTSPIEVGKQTVGTALALNEFAARYFSQGSHLNQNAFELPPMNPDALAETKRLTTSRFDPLTMNELSSAWRDGAVIVNETSKTSTNARPANCFIRLRVSGVFISNLLSGFHAAN